MAVEAIGIDWSVPASADLSTKQYRVCKIHTDGTLVVSSAAVASVDQHGVLQDKPSAAGRIGQFRIGGITKVIAGAACNPGALVMSDANGAVIPATTTKYGIGYVVNATAACANNDVISVYLTGPVYQV